MQCSAASLFIFVKRQGLLWREDTELHNQAVPSNRRMEDDFPFLFQKSTQAARHSTSGARAHI